MMDVSARLNSKQNREKEKEQLNLGECITHMKSDPIDVAPTTFLTILASKTAVLRAHFAKHVELLVPNAFSYRALKTRESRERITQSHV